MDAEEELCRDDRDFVEDWQPRRKRTSKFDIQQHEPDSITDEKLITLQQINPSALEILRSLTEISKKSDVIYMHHDTGELQSLVNYISVTDRAFTDRLERAMDKNFSYILR